MQIVPGGRPVEIEESSFHGQVTLQVDRNVDPDYALNVPEYKSFYFGGSFCCFNSDVA